MEILAMYALGEVGDEVMVVPARLLIVPWNVPVT
tara:strand:- start:1545 stop:1646 length:102 start_codon:yes stop_codon:yes gene_type:complete